MQAPKIIKRVLTSESPIILGQGSGNLIRIKNLGHYSSKLFSLSEAFCRLKPLQFPLITINEIGRTLAHQYKILYFPNMMDDLGKAILTGDLQNACNLMDQAAHAYPIFRKIWTLNNVYEKKRIETSQSITTETLILGQELLSGEEVHVATLSPALLAVLSKQSSLAIALLKLQPMDKDTEIAPLNLSLNQIAETLKLETLREFLNPPPEPLPEPDPEQKEGLPDKMQRLQIVSGLKMK